MKRWLLAALLLGCGADPPASLAPTEPPSEAPAPSRERALPAPTGFPVSWSAIGGPERQSFQVVLGDLDQDGRPEIIVGNTDQAVDVLSLKDGALQSVQATAEVDATQGLALGDLDGDGDLDVATAAFPGVNRVYRNDGGRLALAWTSPDEDESKDVEIADVDGDGDGDLVVANVGPNRVYRNDGAFAFTSAWTAPDGLESDAVALADLDGDGDVDLAVANSSGEGQPDQVFRNDGGTFTLAWSTPASLPASDVALGDLDGDGALDLAFARPEHPGDVWRNAGGLRFERVFVSPDASHSREVRWADLDADGDVDLLACNEGPLQVWTNDSGALQLGALVPHEALAEGVAVGDLNGDGVLDLVLASRSGDVTITPGQPGGAALRVLLGRR